MVEDCNDENRSVSDSVYRNDNFCGLRFANFDFSWCPVPRYSLLLCCTANLLLLALFSKRKFEGVL